MFVGNELISQSNSSHYFDKPGLNTLRQDINRAIKTELGVAMFYCSMTAKFGGDTEKLATFYKIGNLEKISYLRKNDRPESDKGNLHTCNKKYIKVRT